MNCKVRESSRVWVKRSEEEKKGKNRKMSKKGRHDKRKWEEEEQRQEKERGKGETQRANSKGRAALILVDRNIRKSDKGRSKVTRWLQTHTFCQHSTYLLSVYGCVCTHSSTVCYCCVYIFTCTSLCLIKYTSLCSLCSCLHQPNNCNSTTMESASSPLVPIGSFSGFILTHLC